MTGTVSVFKLPYKVELVEESCPPQGIEGGKWFRYIVGEGETRVEGKKTGTLASVTRYAEDFAEQLNARAARGGSYYNPRNTKNFKKK